VQIDRDVEPLPPELPSQAEVVSDPAESACAWRHDHLVQVRVVSNDWCGLRLDQIHLAEQERPLRELPRPRGASARCRQ